jgi:hypothetical protein
VVVEQALGGGEDPLARLLAPDACVLAAASGGRAR